MTQLTARERQVRDCLCKGWKTKEVARKLGIGPRTVEFHRQNILKKYRARNLVELMIAVFDIPDQEVA
jgi:two-component system, LuxR family, sensor histidine kinase TtrS